MESKIKFHHSYKNYNYKEKCITIHNINDRQKIRFQKKKKNVFENYL